jgi:hypothetical protein
MKTKDENFTFWYPVLISEQMAFRDDGTIYTKNTAVGSNAVGNCMVTLAQLLFTG